MNSTIIGHIDERDIAEMGLFKKKQKTEDTYIENRVFGKVYLLGSWHTVDKYEVSVLGRTYSVILTMLVRGADEPINDLQEAAGEEFLKNTHVYMDLFEKELKRKFADLDAEMLHEALEVGGVFFGRDGKVGISCSADLDMDYLEECGVSPDENFGIVVSPSVVFLPSSEEFLDYFE